MLMVAQKGYSHVPPWGTGMISFSLHACCVEILHNACMPKRRFDVVADCGGLVQVIEKALKKLKLDAMIIQQGRLSDNKASVNKDDLLSMVRYGAEMVFSGGGGTITDEDIDAIIAKVTIVTHSYACHTMTASYRTAFKMLQLSLRVLVSPMYWQV